MKLKMKNGFSIINLLMVFVFLGVFGIYGFQIGMGFLDQMAIKGAVKNALIEAKGNENMKEKDIVNSIIKQSAVGTFVVEKDDIAVTSVGRHDFSVEVTHSKTIKITERIKLFMNLNFVEDSK